MNTSTEPSAELIERCKEILLSYPDVAQRLTAEQVAAMIHMAQNHPDYERISQRK